MRTRGLTGAVVLSVLALVMTACGSTSQATPTSPSTSQSSSVDPSPLGAQTTVEDSTEDSSAIPDPTATFMMSGTASDGTSESGTLTLYPIEPATSPVYGEWPPLSDACSVDTSRDAIIPAEISLTNTTSSFPADLTYELIQRFPQDGTSLDTDATYSSGPMCDEGMPTDGSAGDVFGYGSSDQTPAGGMIDQLFYFIVPSYYTPSAPNGDPAVLHQFVLDCQPVNTSVSYGDDYTFTGPGVNPSSHWFRLDGTAGGSLTDGH